MKDESLFGSPNKARQRQNSAANDDFPLTTSPQRSPFSSGKKPLIADQNFDDNCTILNGKGC